jgi:hypothetical protein
MKQGFPTGELDALKPKGFSLLNGSLKQGLGKIVLRNPNTCLAGCEPAMSAGEVAGVGEINVKMS